jgi:hypothetical protein
MSTKHAFTIFYGVDSRSARFELLRQAVSWMIESKRFAARQWARNFAGRSVFNW